ncbi:hypothetical protein [Paracoccus sp. ME4]|uniref:hypothetical protein n=1 Tax=Paracoccus sp. ME4 TaxID=3138066 RepID=UPI00398B617C
MPQAIPVILAFAKTAVGKFLIGTAINLGVSALSAKLNQPKGPKPRDLQTQIRAGAADRVQHFGRVRVGGVLMFADFYRGDPRIDISDGIFSPTYSSGNIACVLLAVSTGGITGVDQWYLDGKPVGVDAEGWVQTAPWRNRVRLRVRTGRGAEAEGGAWDTLRAMFPMRWTAAHRLDGVATVLGEFKAVPPEDVNDVYPGGRPPEITAVIRGTPCFEPATGAESFTVNPIRHLLHYLSDAGSGTVPLAEFDLASWLTAIGDCTDDLPTVGGTRPRYAGGGSHQLAEPQKDVAGRILEGVGGALHLTQAGLVGVRVAKWRAPTIVIDDSKIVSLDCGPGRSKLDRVTTLVPEYVEPSLDYTETTADPWEDARAIARFGEPKPRELSLLTVQHHGQARALTKIAAARENPRVTAAVSLRFWGLRLLGVERVILHRPDRGLDMVPMRIVALSLDLNAGDGVVKVELESDEAAAYAWTAAQEGGKPAAPALSVNGRAPILAPVITGVAVETDAGAPPAYISGTVAPIAGYLAVVQFRRSGGEWVSLTVNQGTGYFRTPGLADGATYDIRAARILGGINAAAVAFGLFGPGDPTKFSPWTTLPGIVVIANGTPPAQPELVEATRSGDTITIAFRPDLGANYAQTGIWRGAPFADATFVRWVRDQSSTVTVRLTGAPAPTTYWLRSGNGSGVTADPLNIGTL